MSKFRKKPVVIDAWPVKDLIAAAQGSWRSLPPPVAEAYERGKILFLPDGMHISTLEGPMTAAFEDMLILGIKGELYSCRGDIFVLTYEPGE